MVVVGRESAARALALLLVSACGGPVREYAIETVRETKDVARASALGATSAERFGLAAVGPAPAASAGAALVWDLPAGWHERPATAMRSANFQVDASGTTECYLTLLAGDGGGLAANANRWRGQLGLAPIGEDELATLERAELLGRSAVLVDLCGTYTGMGDREPAPGYRLLGLVLCELGGSAFLKMAGPAEIVAAQREAFLALARSFGSRGPQAPDATQESAGSLSWNLPAGWSRAPDRPTRLASFRAGASAADPASGLDVSLTLLAGSAGGVRANLDRWRGQMGVAPLAELEFASLERLAMLGTTGLLIEIEGTFQDPASGPLPNALLLGAVCATQGGTVFAKLVGPRESAAAERPRFRSFCSSLRSAP